MNLTTLKAGDYVSVARYTGYGIRAQGTYLVTKANKVRIELVRESDGYTRAYSVKTGSELKTATRLYPDQETFLQSVQDEQRQAAQQQHKAEINGAWRKAREAADSKNLSALKQAIADLELLTEMA